MKYSGFFFRLFKKTMEQVIEENYGKEYAEEIIKKSKSVFKEITLKAPEMGKGNPMAYNVQFALVFAAPYIASEKKIDAKVVQEMMRRGLYHIKWFFSRTDLNTEKGKKENASSIMKYCKWYTPEREAKYPESFKVDFEGKPYEGACYYRITRCAVCPYMKALGVGELMPLFCDLDKVMINLQHGELHREKTIAQGDAYCDYFITGNKE